MADRRRSFSWDHPVIITFLIIAVVASMYLAAEVLKPLALSILLSFALTPLVRWVERRGVPRPAAVALTVLLTLGALGGVVFVVGRQLTALAYDLPKYEENILRKVQILKPKQETALQKASKVASDVAKNLDAPGIGEAARRLDTKKDRAEAVVEAAPEVAAPARAPIQDVRIISQPSFRERLEQAVGPYLETLGVGSFVLILVLFMLMGRDDLSDRIIQLFGHRQITLTTRTMEEIGQRVSRYLAMFATVNTGFGLLVGIGLYFIGVPYAVLWGFLAGALRFIPYVGPASAFALALLSSIAYAEEGWVQPILVVLLFGTIEVVANSFLEPVIYGKTTGVSALGLLVAAMFWTWLWGALGLLLSTPMTVALAVLGKYVPSLRFFATLLGEEAELDKDVRYYQRLLALDQDGATEVVEEALKQTPRVEVFDTVLIPALSRAERDYARDELEDRDQTFIWRVTGDIVDELEDEPEITLDALAPPADGPASAPTPAGPIRVVGIAANDTADALALKMLALVLARTGVALEVVTDASSPLKVAEVVAGHRPDLVLLSHLPPVGLTPARYLVRRLRARFADLPIWVGRWGEVGDSARAAKELTASGATGVVFSLAEARDTILAAARPKAASPAPDLVPSAAGAR